MFIKQKSLHTSYVYKTTILREVMFTKQNISVQTRYVYKTKQYKTESL